ncbi:MAG: esterase-like activity of phytase family protein, partial [Gammaproteobacteria bacterium]|nr:esterase-like activity of phytase family protein [Gammaproteobacteria bacterium]
GGGAIGDWRRRDAEALVARGARNGRRGDTRLVVAFERHPRVAEFDPEGRHLGELELPAVLADPAAYADDNAALESLAEHPELGLLTAPERALASGASPAPGAAAGPRVSMHSLAGMRWDYPLHPAPNAALVDLAALPDGRLVSLERGHGMMYLPVIITLGLSRPRLENQGAPLAVETLAVLDTSKGWSLDNFEGLAWHEGMRFFLVSDDNFNDLQRTLLVYLEVLPGHGTPRAGNVPEFEPHHETRH